MNVKKIVAKEVLIVITSLFITFMFYLIGFVIDYRNEKDFKTKVTQIKAYNEECNSYLLEFRKNSKIDSLYKLQTLFFRNYSTDFWTFNANNNFLYKTGVFFFDAENYFFWQNILSSIKDNTFYQTYSSDGVIQKMEKEEYRTNSMLMPILRKQGHTHGLTLWANHVREVKKEFRNFAINNNLERHVPYKLFNKYKLARNKQKSLVDEVLKYQNYNFDCSSNYVGYGIIFCLVVLFGLRYFIYVLKWSIKNIA